MLQQWIWWCTNVCLQAASDVCVLTPHAVCRHVVCRRLVCGRSLPFHVGAGDDGEVGGRTEAVMVSSGVWGSALLFRRFIGISSICGKVHRLLNLINCHKFGVNVWVGLVGQVWVAASHPFATHFPRLDNHKLNPKLMWGFPCHVITRWQSL